MRFPAVVFLRAWLPVCGVFLAPPWLAAESVRELPSSVVTAEAAGSGSGPRAVDPVALSRAEVARVNGGVNVVSREDASLAPLTGFSEMLRNQVGVDTTTRGTPDATWISIRGSGLSDKTGNGRGITVLQDGFMLNQADGLMELSGIDPDAVDSVEIWRGANALRYGANTLGGAMNLRSSTGRTAPGVRVLGMGGSWGYARGFVSAGGASDDVDGYGAYSYGRTDGYRQNAGGHAHRVNTNVGVRLAEGVENRLFVGFAEYHAGTPGDVTRAVMESAPRSAAPAALLYETYRAYDLVRLGDVLTLESARTRVELGVGGYYRDLDEHGSDNVTDKVTIIGSLNGRVRHDGDWDGHRAVTTVGFNFAAGVVHDNRFTPLAHTSARGAKKEASEQYAYTADVFGEQDCYVTERAAVTLGAQGVLTTRALHYKFGRGVAENRDKEYLGFSPKFGTRYEFDEKNVVFANVSRSFEAPTFAQFKTPRSQQRVNLDAQRAWTLEAGVRGEWRRFRWEIVPYHSWVKGEFMTYSTGPAANDFTTLNADETLHRGVEFGFDVELLGDLGATGSIGDGVRRNRLVLRNTANLADHRFEGDARYGDNRLPGFSAYRQRTELTLELACGFYGGPHVELGTSSYVDSANTYKSPGYVTLGVLAGYRWGDSARVFVEGRNLTGERFSPLHSTLADAAGRDVAVFRPSDGPSVYAGVEWRF